MCFPVYFLLRTLIPISASFLLHWSPQAFFSFFPYIPSQLSLRPWEHTERTTYLEPLSKLDFVVMKKLYRFGKTVKQLWLEDEGFDGSHDQKHF